VTVDTTPETWARFLTAPPEARRLPGDDVRLVGSRAAARAFARAFGAQLDPA
jgi:hypothetical protein